MSQKEVSRIGRNVELVVVIERKTPSSQQFLLNYVFNRSFEILSLLQLLVYQPCHQLRVSKLTASVFCAEPLLVVADVPIVKDAGMFSDLNRMRLVVGDYSLDAGVTGAYEAHVGASFAGLVQELI